MNGHARGEDEALYTTGATINAAAQQLAVPLFDVGEGALRAGGWVLEGPGPEGCLLASRFDSLTQSPAFLSVCELDAPALHAVCLVREFDLGGLAGALRAFSVQPGATSVRRVIEYVSVLPWPLRPRRLLVEMQMGVHAASGTVLVLGRSMGGGGAVAAGGSAASAGSAASLAAPGREEDVNGDVGRASGGDDDVGCAAATHGSCHYSFYAITPLGPARCRLLRAINVDMHLPGVVPGWAERRALSAHYRGDAVEAARVLAGWPGSALAARMAAEEEACYGPLRAAVERVLGAGVAG